ncbi:MAG: class II SORL domain-containing protein [Candidatus Omnitrophica bacterium]|nr:class II SORL domain-containing protein [Candidatus Omnitrophota bacterium]
MSEFKELYQSADWKQEKHVPVIDAPESVKKGEFFSIEVTIGKEVAHPNKTEHHIAWVDVYFQPEGSKFPYQIGKTEFSSHGASTEGPDTSSVYTHHRTSLSFKTDKAGTLFASSYCNIHGLWENSKKISLE